MIGIVVAGYRDIGVALVESLNHVKGEKVPNIVAVNAMEEEAGGKAIRAAIQQVNKGAGVVLLTDAAADCEIFNTTRWAIAAAKFESGTDTVVVSGANLPLLIKLSDARHEKSLQEAVNAATGSGRKYITVASQLLSPVR